MANANENLIALSTSNNTTGYLSTPLTIKARIGLSYGDPKFIATVSLCSIVCFLSVCGNLFNLIVIYRTPVLHDTNNLLIFHLALIDFLNGLIVVPVSLITSIIGYTGHSLCQFQGFVLFLLYTGSLAATSAISIDRCNAVLNPFNYKCNIGWQKCVLSSIYIWSLPIVIATLPLLGLERYGLGRYFLLLFCGISFEFYEQNYIAYWIMMVFIVTAIAIIVTSYSIIFMVALRKSLYNQAQNRKLMKSIRTTALLVGSNLLCWLPYTVYGIESFLVRYKFEIYTPNAFKVAAVLLIYCNAAINPFIFAITNSIIREKFIRLFTSIRIDQSP